MNTPVKEKINVGTPATPEPITIEKVQDGTIANMTSESLTLPEGFTFVDPRSPTVGIKRTPMKDVFELNAKLDAINFELFQEEFAGVSSDESQSENTPTSEQQEKDDQFQFLNIMEAEDYYAKFTQLKDKHQQHEQNTLNNGSPQRHKPKSFKRKHGLDLAPIEHGSPQHALLKAQSLRQRNGLHSPSGLYCMSPASKTKFSHFFESSTNHSKQPQEQKDSATPAVVPKHGLTQKRLTTYINKENGGNHESPIRIDIESPNGLNVPFNDETYGTFFSPCHTRRKVRRIVNTTHHDHESAPSPTSRLR